jgi:dihydroorotase
MEGGMPDRYDLLLKGGRVIDPAAAIDAVSDVAVRDGRIAAVRAGIPAASASEVVNVANALVLPGMIDSHAHVFEHMAGRFGLNPDVVGVRSGVPTVVDLGCASFMSMGAFRHYVVERAETRVFSFISIYAGGEGHLSPDMAGAGIDVEACVRCIEANRDLVKGVKVNAEIGSMSIYGLDKVRKAKQAARTAGVPLYVHFGQLFPVSKDSRIAYDVDAILPDVTELLEPGDIMAHPFSRHPGGFVNAQRCVHPIVREAVSRGVRIDVGHGSHFSFDMARKVLDAGILPYTLGADLHGYNTQNQLEPGVVEEHPDPEMAAFSGDARFSLTRAMVELLALGVSLEQVVPMVTSHCAQTLKLEGELGTLRPGVPADVTVLANETGRWTLRDNDGTKVRTERMLSPLFCLRAGRRFDADATILPVAEAA